MLLLCLTLLLLGQLSSMRTTRRLELRDKAKEMFEHGFHSYMKHAFPKDELNPISCTGRSRTVDESDNWSVNDVLGNFSLTLVDSLDTLAVIGDIKGLHKAVEQVIEFVPSFDLDSRVQVFEVTIRILGGLLSAHLLITDNTMGFYKEQYNDELLALSVDLADRLLPAFKESQTGIPWPRVNLRRGVLSHETTSTCAAGAGSLLLEFGVLSRLTGNMIYEQVSKEALKAIYYRRSPLGIVGNGINMSSGKWVEVLTGIGAGIDSFYEYLFKADILFGDDPMYYKMFGELIHSVNKWIKDPNLFVYKNIDFETGELQTTWVDSLAAFWPGLQVLHGDLEGAIYLHQFYFSIWRKYSAMPERFDFHSKTVSIESYPLRPELVESTYFLYQATKNPYYLHVGERILEDIERNHRTLCGFAGLRSVLTKTLDDRMESFFLSETMKYLYLLFDIDNKFNKLDSNFVFTTEGHIFITTHQKLRRRSKANVTEDSSKVASLTAPEPICAKYKHIFTIQKDTPDSSHHSHNMSAASKSKMSLLASILEAAGLPTLPLPIAELRRINSAVGMSEQKDEFFHHVIIPAQSRINFLKRPLSTSYDISETELTWLDLYRYGKQWLFDEIGDDDLFDDSSHGQVCLVSGEHDLARAEEAAKLTRDFVLNNNHPLVESDKGPLFAVEWHAGVPLAYALKLSLPAGVTFTEKTRIIKTAQGFIANTLLGIDLIVSKANKNQDYYRISKLGQYYVGSSDIVKVHKSGIFWLLGDFEGEENKNQNSRPGKLEYEKVLVEAHFADSSGMSHLQRYGGGVASFGAAILPGQYFIAPIVPLIVTPYTPSATNGLGIGDISLGCEYSDYSTSPHIRGSVVLLRRGVCSFFQKTMIAEWAGAIGCMIIGNGFVDNDRKTTTMTPSTTQEKEDGWDIGIIAVMLSLADSLEVMEEMRTRIMSSELDDVCAEYHGRDQDIYRNCVPISIIGELPPAHPIHPPQQMVLQFNNQPINNLHIIPTAPKRQIRWTKGGPNTSDRDPRRRLRGGRGLLDPGSDLSCLTVCLLRTCCKSRVVIK